MMLKQRALSAVVFVPVFLGLALLGGIFFDIFLALILAFAGFEYARMLKANGFQVSTVLIIASMLAIVLLRIFSSITIELFLLPVIMAGFGAFGLWKYEHGEHQAFQIIDNIKPKKHALYFFYFHLFII